MKQIYTLILLLVFVINAKSQITQWNFNSATADAMTSTGTTSPSIGAGTISLIGGVTSTFASGAADGGSSDPATGDDSGLNTTTYPAQGAANKTAGIEMKVSTVGFTNIQLTWDQRHSNTASNTIVLQYSTDGTNFTDFQTYTANAGDTWFNGRTANLSAITALNNNANAAFRIVTAFSTGTTYSASNTPSSYGTTSTLRYDMVTVTGTQVMPVNLISFTGELQASISKLKWATSSEKNNEYFEIQRSTDAKTFQSIGRIDAGNQKTGANNYAFIDESPEIGNNYYRLKQVDLDGQYEYSKVINVKRKFSETLAFPNPAREVIFVNSDFNQRFYLVDFLGKMILSTYLQKGKNEIMVGNFQKGLYLGKLESGENFKILLK